MQATIDYTSVMFSKPIAGELRSAMGTAIRAIETTYKGYRMRSRLEARWAVFFDALGIDWEYEPEGYKVGLTFDESMCGGDVDEKLKAQRWYLPDFRLPKLKSWVEVKGDAGKLDFNLLADATDWDCSLPDMYDSFGDDRGLLILGPIPEPRCSAMVAHPILQHAKGGFVSLARFVPQGIRIVNKQLQCFDSSWGDQDGQEWTFEVKKHFDGKRGWPCRTKEEFTEQDIVRRAYAAARSARFEHGERGYR